MLSLIVAELQEVFAAVGRGDAKSYAFHTGKAGGVAAATGAWISLLDEEAEDYDPDYPVYVCRVLCDAISSAYEYNFLDELDDILVELMGKPDDEGEYDDSLADRIGWEEYGIALHEACQAREADDELRYALMTGFASGLMFKDPGRRYEDRSILDAITEAYTTESGELLDWARARIAAGVRMTDPAPFMGKEQYERYMAEKLETLRWVQNFGLHHARAGDEAVAVPGSMAINDDARRLVHEPEDAAAYISRGHEKRNRGDYDGAIAEFGRAIELDPDDAGAYHGRGEAKRGKGDFDGAIADCDRAIELDPNDPGGCNIRGMSKWQKGDHDGAIADFDRAIELDLDHAGAYFIRGMIKEEKGDYHSAITDFDRAIELDPDDAGQHDHRGFAKMSVGDYEGAIADFDRAIELDPADTYAQQSRILAIEERGDS